jgi:UDP-N-acetylglucosamine--N-acetylmuramyl-(pentapeptide) pyrophosphoryl-undecaprenol N-acetylglucosamine transferase
MKILLTGGGTGGHFYPIIAIAQELNKLAKEEKLSLVKLYFMSDDPYDERMLYENNISFLKVSTGKIRRYFSILNIIDMFKTILAIPIALWHIFLLYPDVVISKGGYASFPALFASRILRIPVIIHESDSIPGKTNKWASKFAKKIAISYAQAAEYFPKEKTALTGNPIRQEILVPMKDGAHELLKLEKGIPVLFVLGGSQGAQIINETILESAPDIIKKYQIIHQVGEKNIEEMKNLKEVVVGEDEHKDRYKIFGYLNNEAMKMSAGVADLVISRAGSTIFEIAVWGIPSIIIPITDTNGDHQRKNAYSYARTGAGDVIEEKNLTPHLFVSEVDRLMGDSAKREEMSRAAKNFARTDAAEKIARQAINILMEHQR